MASDKRVHVTLECQECRRRNYITTKSKANTRERIQLQTISRWCRSHENHKETRSASTSALPVTAMWVPGPTFYTQGCPAPAGSLPPYRPRFRLRVGGRDPGQWLNW